MHTLLNTWTYAYTQIHTQKIIHTKIIAMAMSQYANSTVKTEHHFPLKLFKEAKLAQSRARMSYDATYTAHIGSLYWTQRVL